MTRDQQRAKIAYQNVLGIAAGTEALQDDYRTLVRGLGANIMRSGLSATISYIERYRNSAASEALLGHLSAANIPHLAPNLDVGQTVRGLGLDDYMLVTREVLMFTVWLRRAVQGLLGD